MNIQLDQKDYQETIDSNKSVLLDFYADWCGPCQTLLPTIHKLAEEFEGDVVIKKINIDTNKELASKFGVRSIPTLIHITDGKEVGRHTGVISENELKTKINQLKFKKMKTRIETLNPETTTGKSKELFDAVQKKLGFIPNLIKVFGNSPATLQTYLSLGELTASGTFSNKFREQLALAIAEENSCNYCLSAHTAIGKMNGLTDEQTENNRQGIATDERIQAGLQFAQEVTKNRGQVSSEVINAVKNAGYNDGEILEIVLNVVSNTLTNYVNHIAETEVDFPSVEAGKFAVTQ